METIIYTPAPQRSEDSYPRLLGYLIGNIKGVLNGVEGKYAKVDPITVKLLIRALLEVENPDSEWGKRNIVELKALAEKLGYQVQEKP